MQISKRSPFDYAIIGAGISGACMAYHLDKLGKSVIVIEKDKIASGGSGAAGAFLSPKLASNSPYTSFINSSFEFSIKFYKENFPKFLLLHQTISQIFERTRCGEMCTKKYAVLALANSKIFLCADCHISFSPKGVVLLSILFVRFS